MYALDLRKPDGRQLTLYSRQPIDPADQRTEPVYRTAEWKSPFTLEPSKGRMG